MIAWISPDMWLGVSCVICFYSWIHSGKCVDCGRYIKIRGINAAWSMELGPIWGQSGGLNEVKKEIEHLNSKFEKIKLEFEVSNSLWKSSGRSVKEMKAILKEWKILWREISSDVMKHENDLEHQYRRIDMLERQVKIIQGMNSMLEDEILKLKSLHSAQGRKMIENSE